MILVLYKAMAYRHEQIHDSSSSVHGEFRESMCRQSERQAGDNLLGTGMSRNFRSSVWGRHFPCKRQAGKERGGSHVWLSDSGVTWSGMRGRHRAVSRRAESERATWMFLNAAGFSTR